MVEDVRYLRGGRLLSGRIGSLILFGIISFLAMREYMTLVPTRRGDHRTLFWSFFVIMPMQYYLVGIQWYGSVRYYDPGNAPAFIFLPALPSPETRNISWSAPRRFSSALWCACTH